MVNKSFDSDIKKILTYDEVINLLQKLNTELPRYNLSNLLVFNKAYLVVTQTIYLASQNNYFSNPKFIEYFTADFAKYYFQAVRDLKNNNKNITPAWQTFNNPQHSLNFIYLLQGAKAHIVHDLPLTLLSNIAGSEKTSMLNDIRKIDLLLLKCGKQILNTFDEENKIINSFKNSFKYIYYYPVMMLILYWRIVAWVNYKQHQRENSKKAKFLQRVVNFS